MSRCHATSLTCQPWPNMQVAPTALPVSVPKPDVSPGDYVVVIGRLMPGDPEAPSPDNYTIKAQKVAVTVAGVTARG